MDQQLRKTLKEKAELISERAQQIARHANEYLDYEVADRMKEIGEFAQMAFDMCPAKKSDDHKSHLPKEEKESKSEAQQSEKELPSGSDAKSASSNSSNGAKRK